VLITRATTIPTNPILIVTNRADRTADWLILELEQRQARFIRFNTEDYPRLVRLRWGLDECALSFGDQWIEVSEIQSIWYRRPVPPQLSRELTADRAAWVAGESVEALRGIWRTYHGLWVNHPDANELASSKLEQLRRAQNMGFQVPETLVTSDRTALLAFADGGKPLICKPVKSGYVEVNGDERLFFTSVVGEADVRAFGGHGPEPYMFQKLIEKQYEIRVTVIGELIFAVRLDSQLNDDTRTDWRRGDQTKLRHSLIELPREVAELCVALVRSYGLAFGAIDLAVDNEGRHIFFEVNPNGQWAWLEQVTGAPLRSAIADLLLGSLAGLT
jgi:glutathione synthase/RimK-type ligase-like ATP-grasp enzyme